MNQQIAQSVWTPYEQGNKKPPVVPEPWAHGAFLLAFLLAVAIARKLKR